MKYACIVGHKYPRETCMKTPSGIQYKNNKIYTFWTKKSKNAT